MLKSQTYAGAWRSSPRLLFILLLLTALAGIAPGQAEALQMATGTYPGNGTTSQAITGVGFQPDVVIVK
ncbi:MAG: hypothetical protein IH800_15240, partial [Myxococcales bacterium]|nr:hypothetical protein [Myxococcales bacterium]